MKIIELLYQSIHPSPQNRFQNDGLSQHPAVYPTQYSVLKGKTNDHRNIIMLTLYTLCIISMPILLTRRLTVFKIVYKRFRKWGVLLCFSPSRILLFIKILFKQPSNFWETTFWLTYSTLLFKFNKGSSQLRECISVVLNLPGRWQTPMIQW